MAGTECDRAWCPELSGWYRVQIWHYTDSVEQYSSASDLNVSSRCLWVLDSIIVSFFSVIVKLQFVFVVCTINLATLDDVVKQHLRHSYRMFDCLCCFSRFRL